jgi:hypothetical protein
LFADDQDFLEGRLCSRSLGIHRIVDCDGATHQQRPPNPQPPIKHDKSRCASSDIANVYTVTVSWLRLTHISLFEVLAGDEPEPAKGFEACAWLRPLS